MADVSRYVSGSSGVGGSSGRADEGFWSYAVPAHKENSPTRGVPREPTSNDQSSYLEDRRPPQQQYKQSSSSNSQSGVRSRNSLETTRVSSQGGLRPPPPIQHQDLSGASSEADSLLDLYRSNGASPDLRPTNGNAANGASRKRVASQDRSKARTKAPRGATSVAEETPEELESKWIHRDKLAKIESREMAEIGVRLGRPSRAGSRAKSTKTNKSIVDADFGEGASVEADHARRESEKLRQVVDGDSREQRYASDGEGSSSHPAFAGHTSQRSLDRPMTGRPGTSRIPVPLSTPASPGDGDSPLELTRKRSDSFGYQKHRTRSRSGSQNLLDASKQDSPSTPTTRTFGPQLTSPQASPPKNRTPSSATTSEAVRKASATRNVSGKKPRADSTTDSPRRPTTGSGRPPTARPEGDPPWIATMYKPDPRLPPEEQMLPTHARRMAELQADAQQHQNAQVESEYTLVEPQETNNSRRSVDAGAQESQAAQPQRFYPPSSLHEGRASFQQDIGQGSLNRASWQRAHDLEKQNQGQWPLRTLSGHSMYPPNRQQQVASPTKLEATSPDHGGYNLMPTIQTQQKETNQHSNRVSHRSVNSLSNLSPKEQEMNAAQAPINQPIRLQDDEKHEDLSKEEKGCVKCCVIM